MINRLTQFISRYPEWLVSALAFLAVALACFAHVLLRPHLIAGGDDLLIYYYWESFTRSQLAEGALPLWNPYILSGYPAVGNPQVMIFYPPAAVLRLLPIAFAFGAGYALHLWWLGLGLYWLMRRQGVGKGGAAVSAVSFMLGGFVAPRYAAGHVDLLYSVSWMPWAILCWQNTLQRRTFGWATLSGAVVGLHFLGGHPATLMLTLFLLALFSLFWLTQNFRHIPAKEQLRLAGLGAVAAVTVAGGFAMQVLPMVELIRLSTHAATALRDCGLPFQLVWQDLPSVLLASNPFEVFLPWERNGYFGAAALLLAALGVIYPPDALKRWRWFLIILFALGLVFGFNPHLAGDTRLLPSFSSFRVPSRFMMLASFSSAALAGIGFDWLGERIRRGDGAPRWLIAMALVLALAAAPADWIFLNGGKVEAARSSLYWLTLTLGGGLSAPRYVLAVVLLAMSYRKQWSSWLPAAFVVLVLADGWLFAHPYIRAAPRDSITNAAAWLPPTNPAEYRITIEPYMFANSAMEARAASAQGYASIVPAHYADVVDETPAALRCGSVEHAFITWPNALNLLSVRYFVNVTGAVDLPNASEVVVGSNVYEFDRYLPRATVVNQILHASSAAEAIRWVQEGSIDLSRTAVVETAETPPLLAGSDTAATARITHYSPMQVTLTVDAPDGGMLVLNDVWYPGWLASVNGQPAKLYRANGAFRAVIVPAGQNTVTFNFESRPMVSGLTISAITWGGLITLLIAFRRRRP